MIDLHSHILYDLDDGATTLNEAVAMGRMAAAEGVRVIVATPHSSGSPASGQYHPPLIRARVADLNAALAAAHVPIEVIAGTEIYFESDLVTQLEHGDLLTYGHSRAILLEMPDNTFPPALDDTLRDLHESGYRVVLAHPERIIEVQDDPNRLLPLIARGVLMQITAEALTGAQGERVQALTETLLTHGMAHVLASDAHGLPPRRSPSLVAAYARAAALVGQNTVNALVITVPAAVLHEQPIELPPPRPVTQ